VFERLRTAHLRRRRSQAWIRHTLKARARRRRDRQLGGTTAGTKSGTEERQSALTPGGTRRHRRAGQASRRPLEEVEDGLGPRGCAAPVAHVATTDVPAHDGHVCAIDDRPWPDGTQRWLSLHMVLIPLLAASAGHRPRCVGPDGSTGRGRSQRPARAGGRRSGRPVWVAHHLGGRHCIGHVSPVEFEAEYYRHHQPAQPPLAADSSLHRNLVGSRSTGSRTWCHVSMGEPQPPRAQPADSLVVDRQDDLCPRGDLCTNYTPRPDDFGLKTGPGFDQVVDRFTVCRQGALDQHYGPSASAGTP
jgi:hypothetical protein